MLDRRLAVVLLEKVVKRAELLSQLRLAYPLREAEVQPCPAENAIPGPQYIAAQTGAGRDAVADQQVVHHVHAQRVKDPLLEKVAVRAKDVIVVVAAFLIVDEVDRLALGGALVFKAKTGQ